MPIPDTAEGRADDRDLVKLAYRLTADLAKPNAAIYWTDLLLTAAVAYGGMALAWHAGFTWLGLTAAVVAAFAIYRGISFIHELVHLRRRTPAGFWLAWHALFGVPWLVPAFMYDGVHNLHHSKAHYGTAADPEYLPLASYRPRATLYALATAAIEPMLLVVRFLLITPVAALVPAFRPHMVERMSSMVMNPEFRRRDPPQPRGAWIAVEIVITAYVWGAVILAVVGVVPWRALALWLALWSGLSIVNMARTLVAHHYGNDEGDALDVIAQVLDTASVPPPALLPMLWAPVGLRYHALHHLLPNLPYHNLGAAHRRLIAGLPSGTAYPRTAHRRARDILARLLKAQSRQRPDAASKLAPSAH